MGYGYQVAAGNYRNFIELEAEVYYNIITTNGWRTGYEQRRSSLNRFQRHI